MTNNLRTPPPGLPTDVMADLLLNLSDAALDMATTASKYDRKAAFQVNAPDLIVAQSIASANDSNPTMVVVRDEFVDNMSITDVPDQKRFAKTTADFGSNKTVVKTILTPSGHRRGYEVSGKVIKANFGPSKYDMTG